MPADAVTLTARVVENTKKHHAGVEAQVLIAAASSAASGFLFLGGSVTGNARWWGWKRELNTILAERPAMLKQRQDSTVTVQTQVRAMAL